MPDAKTEGPDAGALAQEIVQQVHSLPRADTVSLRGVRRTASRSARNFTPRDVLAMIGQLLDQNELGLRFVAYELIKFHRETFRTLNARRVRELARRLDSWAAVDMFACYVAGPAWRERQISDEVIHRWARSRDRWWRRAALVSTVPLNAWSHGGHGDADRTCNICRLLIEDRDDMIVKALSWALRELAKRERPAAEEFMRQYGSRLAARVRREVNNKLATGRKNPRRTRAQAAS